MKKLWIAILIVALGIGIVALTPVTTTKKSVEGWKTLFTPDGESFQYHAGMIKYSLGIRRVWVKVEDELVLVEIRDDFMYQILEGGNDTGKLKNIKPDTPEAELVRLLF